MGRLNARQARKKILAITGLFAMGAMLMLPIFTALPALAGGGGAKGGPPQRSWQLRRLPRRLRVKKSRIK